MTWGDVLVESTWSESALVPAIAHSFGAPVEDVVVVESIESAPDGTPIIVEVRDAAGDFRSHLSIFVDEKYAGQAPVDVVSRLCGTLGTRALISDASENPFAMLLVGEASGPRPVSLDPDALDRDEYRLQR